MQVLDGFLDEDDFAALCAGVAAPGFPWQPTKVLHPARPGLDEAANVQDVHGFYQRKPGFAHDSRWLPLVEPVLRRLPVAELLKVKLNRTWRRDAHVVFGFHCDTRRPGATTGVYYLNTNDGFTAFEDGARVESVANRLVLFDAARRHSGASCTDQPQRLVLNINFIARPGAAPAVSA